MSVRKIYIRKDTLLPQKENNLNFIIRDWIIISPLPATAGGDFKFALRSSVCHTSVFDTFFSNASRYWAEIC